jgi:hypothetical protein
MKCNSIFNNEAEPLHVSRSGGHQWKMADDGHYWLKHVKALFYYKKSCCTC